MHVVTGGSWSLNDLLTKQDVERFRRGQVVLAKTEDIQGDTSQNLAVVAPEDDVWIKRNAETAPVELAADSDYRSRDRILHGDKPEMAPAASHDGAGDESSVL